MKGIVRRFQRILVIVAVLGLILSLFSTVLATLVSGLPFHAQIKWYYCGPACLEMVFHFYGPDIAQGEIADAARTDVAYGGTYSDDMRRASHFSNLSRSKGADWPGSINGYTGRGLGYAAFEYYFPSINGLKPLIDSGYPIVVLTAGDVGKSWGHFRVVIGYDDNSATMTMQDPLYGTNYKLDYATFDDWWQYWSGRWGLFVHPWNVATTAPATVQNGTTFTVSSTITYPCPPPFQTSDFPASPSQATIQLPPGLSLASGETLTKTLNNGILTAGSSASVQWNVNADNPGTFSIAVEAEGRVSGSVTTHGSNPEYSYSDRIGGTGTTSMNVLAPTYNSSTLNANSTLAGSICDFSCKWQDPFGLSGFIFEHNDTGTLKNETWNSFNNLGTDNSWSNASLTLNDTADAVIQWKFYANDTSNNWNNTMPPQYLTVKQGTHDVAVINLVPSRTFVGPGFPVNINVTVTNYGDYPETFNVTAYANKTAVNPPLRVNLASNQYMTVILIWNTSGFSEGNYIVSACAEPLPKETNIQNNNYTYGIITIAAHDISLTSVAFSQQNPFAGNPIQVYVTVQNNGGNIENFNVDVNCTLDNETSIGTQTVTLSPDETTILSFTWTPTLEGLYTIKAYTSEIIDDPSPGDNIQIARLYVDVVHAGGCGMGGGGIAYMK
jgi:hypothetical protein